MSLPTLSPLAKKFQVLPLATRSLQRQPIVPNLGRQPRVHLWHIGCQMNDADRKQLAEQLAEIGCVPEVPLEDADLAVLITCTVRQNAEQKVFGKFKELAKWKELRSGRAIALTGCMAVEHGSALLDRIPSLDYIFDVREPEGFLSKLQALYGDNIEGRVPLPASDRLSAYVPVIGGCNEMCTYCIVPFVRGREISRDANAIIDDIRRLVDRGVREVTLLGQNVNSYMDPTTGHGLAKLMEKVDAVPGLWRQRFMTSHPRNAHLELFSAMRDLPTACEQLHLPVQAGDNDLLKRMNRVYSIEEYREVLANAQAIVPDVTLSTDIIVGFCGETEAELAGTEKLIKDIEFDVIHLQAYSVRPGTAAARRDDDVPLVEKKRRLNYLLNIQREISLKKNQTLVGKTVEVLIEGEAEGGRLYGRTRQNRVVWMPANVGVRGQLVNVAVNSANVWQLEAA